MITSIQQAETLNHRYPFYSDALLHGTPSAWMVPESQRPVIAHYSSYGGTFDWLICNWAPSVNIGYGFVRLDGNSSSASWRSIDLGELEGLCLTQPVIIHGTSVELTIPVVERTPDFKARSFGEVRRDPAFGWINESAHVQPLSDADTGV